MPRRTVGRFSSKLKDKEAKKAKKARAAYSKTSVAQARQEARRYLQKPLSPSSKMIVAAAVVFTAVAITVAGRLTQTPPHAARRRDDAIASRSHAFETVSPQRESSTHHTQLQHSKVHPPHAAGWRTKSKMTP